MDFFNETKHFDFDDILIIPNVATTINSRYSDIVLPPKLPLFTAPMDTVVDYNNMNVFIENKINVCLPRTINYNFIINNNHILQYIINNNIFISLGFDDIEQELKTKFVRFHPNPHILIDVANGHMLKIIEYAKKIKEYRPDAIIMVGNIANPHAYLLYATSQCVDYIRVGIGNGGGCLTTKQSGIGYPMASLIKETFEMKQKFISEYPELKTPYIIADGGMKNYSDIIKALALGADFVMVGSIFNKAIESCANNYFLKMKIPFSLAKFLFRKKFPIYKYFRGMSTKQAQKAMGKSKFKTSEGVVRFRRVEYTLSGWVENFEHYLRNAMSYSDAKFLSDFIGKCYYHQITKSAYDRFNK